MDNKAMREMINNQFNQRKPRVGQGQSLLEYTMIIVVVIAALSAMSLYVQRSVQANLKMMEHQVNEATATASPAGPVALSECIVRCRYHRHPFTHARDRAACRRKEEEARQQCPVCTITIEHIYEGESSIECHGPEGLNVENK